MDEETFWNRLGEALGVDSDALRNLRQKEQKQAIPTDEQTLKKILQEALDNLSAVSEEAQSPTPSAETRPNHSAKPVSRLDQPIEPDILSAKDAAQLEAIQETIHQIHTLVAIEARKAKLGMQTRRALVAITMDSLDDINNRIYEWQRDPRPEFKQKKVNEWADTLQNKAAEDIFAALDGALENLDDILSKPPSIPQPSPVIDVPAKPAFQWDQLRWVRDIIKWPLALCLVLLLMQLLGMISNAGIALFTLIGVFVLGGSYFFLNLKIASDHSTSSHWSFTKLLFLGVGLLILARLLGIL